MRNPEYHGKGPQGRSFFSVFFRGVGLALLAGGLIYGVVILVFVLHADHVTGTVIKLEETRNAAPFMQSTNGSGVYYYPVIQFRTAAGKLVQFRAATGSQKVEFSVGTRVPVLYDPSSPSDGRIDTLWGVWGAPLILLGIGAVFLILGFVAPKGFGSLPRRLTRE